MPVERIDPSCFGVVEGSGVTPEEASDHDFAIRSGLCPNGCARMEITPPPYIGQECPQCKFWCNSLPDRAGAS